LFGGIPRRSAHADDTFLPKHFAEVNFNPITFPESENDMPTDTAATPKTFQMGATPASVDVEPDDTLQFTNDPATFPTFEVVFLDSSPNGSKLTFEGTSEIDILVTVEGEFDYFIRHHPKKGKTVRTGVFSVRSCGGGCP
jgi:plastocyanin